MRIRAAHALVLLLHGALAGATVIALVTIRQAWGREQQALRSTLEAAEALQSFRDGNQWLMVTAFAAVAKEDSHQSELYWRELLVARRRERAGITLRSLGLRPQEQSIWKAAEAASDALARQQQVALQLADRGDKARGMRILLNASTLHQQQAVRFLSESLQRRLNERFGFELATERQWTSQLAQLMVALVVLDLALVFVVLLVLTPRFITRPLLALNQRLQCRLNGQPADQPNLQGAADEIKALGASLGEQESIQQQLARAQWVTSNQTQISEVLQRSPSLAGMGASLLEELGGALDLGAGALYVLNRSQTQLEPIAGFATTALPSAIEPGEGLVGECFSQAHPLEIGQVPEGYLPIRSGLGQIQPASLWLLPVLSGGAVLGVLELALLRPMAPEQRDLVLNVLPLLALAMERLNERDAPFLAHTNNPPACRA